MIDLLAGVFLTCGFITSVCLGVRAVVRIYRSRVSRTLFTLTNAFILTFTYLFFARNLLANVLG